MVPGQVTINKFGKAFPIRLTSCFKQNQVLKQQLSFQVHFKTAISDFLLANILQKLKFAPQNRCVL